MFSLIVARESDTLKDWKLSTTVPMSSPFCGDGLRLSALITTVSALLVTEASGLRRTVTARFFWATSEVVVVVFGGAGLEVGTEVVVVVVLVVALVFFARGAAGFRAGPCHAEYVS